MLAFVHFFSEMQTVQAILTSFILYTSLKKTLILTSSQHLHQQVPYLGHSLKVRNDIYSC